jgi:D-alanyl-D-alanine carboxypeptidase/D-alanyl-D-alanine-endopeptidase (penicillin-binding protein 4)
MRIIATALTAIALAAGAAPAAGARAQRAAQASLRRALAAGIRDAGSASGAYVVDLTTGHPLFAAADRVARMPASVEKIYTTSTALLLFGGAGSLSTSVLATGSLGANGTFTGTLYLRGGGDPTFGSASFDRGAYGTGATMPGLVANLLAAMPVTAVNGQIVGDESWFDSSRGTAPYGFQTATDIGGPLSALDYDRGLADEQGTALQDQPARFAAQQLVLALRSAGVAVPRGTPTSVGTTPPEARTLATVTSPPVATLLRLTNVPSDNFFAEMLLKDIGAQFGATGSSAAGAAVVRAQMAGYGVHPAVEDGSGLSRRDRTTPRDVVTVLSRLAVDRDFTSSLPVAGRTGTLSDRMLGTYAAGRCRAKTGTLHDVSNLAGYCRARDGHTLVFTFLMNSVDPTTARGVQDAMTVALARYSG